MKKYFELNPFLNLSNIFETLMQDLFCVTSYVVHKPSKFCQTLVFSFAVATSQEKHHNPLFVDMINKL